MGVALIAVLLVVGLFLASSVALSRTTREVGSAREDEYLELEGSWVRYRVSGGGPPVLLVHGWLQSGRLWERLAARLEGRFTVYTLDLVGFGESDKPISGYGIRYGSRLLYAFCAHFGLTRAAVVGQDLGGAMALKLAADHPDVVGRLVLVATPADEDQIDLPTPLWLATLPVVGSVFYSLGRLVGPVRRLWMRPFVLAKESLTEAVVEDAGRSTPAAVAKSLSVMRREISGGRLKRQVSLIRVPVLLVAGEEDEIVDPQSTDDWSRALNAQEQIALLNDCGHFPALERPREFEARVLAFLTGDPRHLEAIRDEPPPESPPGDDETQPLLDDDDHDTGGPESPNVFRGQNARYTPVDADDDEEAAPPEKIRRVNPPREELREESHSGNGVDRGPGVWHPAERGVPEDRGDGPYPEDRAANPLPEVPRDLFEWPSAWREFRPGDPGPTDPDTAEPGAAEPDTGAGERARDIGRDVDREGDGGRGSGEPEGPNNVGRGS